MQILQKKQRRPSGKNYNIQPTGVKVPARKPEKHTPYSHRVTPRYTWSVVFSLGEIYMTKYKAIIFVHTKSSRTRLAARCSLVVGGVPTRVSCGYFAETHSPCWLARRRSDNSLTVTYRIKCFYVPSQDHWTVLAPFYGYPRKWYRTVLHVVKGRVSKEINSFFLRNERRNGFQCFKRTGTWMIPFV